MNEKYERQMKKGVLDMLVLKLLESEPKHGYRIIQEMKEKSGNTFSLKDGTLYPVLYRLEDDGLVKSHWSEAEEDREEQTTRQTRREMTRQTARQVPRKYYEITEEGRQALMEIQSVWNKISDGIEKIMGGSKEQ